MPVEVRKSSKGGYDIVEVASGKHKGHSESKKDAQASARIRNEAHREKTRGKR